MKSARPVASGPTTRSTDECEMSRSCHSATSSSAGAGVRAQQAREPAQVLGQDRVLLVRHRRASPSAPCRTPPSPRRPRCAASGGRRARSARSRCRAAPAPEVARRGDRARRSASATVSRREAERRRAPRCSIAGIEVGVGADRAGDLADRDLLARATRAPPARARARRTSRANTRPAVIGSAWMPCERPIVGVARCSSARRRQAARRQIDAREDLVAPPRPAGSRATRRARPTTSSRGAASAPARPPAPRRGSGTRSRRGACAPRSRGCAPGRACRPPSPRTAAGGAGRDRPRLLHRGAGGQLDASQVS